MKILELKEFIAMLDDPNNYDLIDDLLEIKKFDYDIIAVNIIDKDMSDVHKKYNELVRFHNKMLPKDNKWKKKNMIVLTSPFAQIKSKKIKKLFGKNACWCYFYPIGPLKKLIKELNRLGKLRAFL